MEYGSLGGVFNLFSSEQFDNHLIATAALSLVERKQDQVIHKSLGLPVELKGLLTLDRNRTWQLRNEFKLWTEVSGPRNYQRSHFKMKLEKRTPMGEGEGIWQAQYMMKKTPEGGLDEKFSIGLQFLPG